MSSYKLFLGNTSAAAAEPDLSWLPVQTWIRGGQQYQYAPFAGPVGRDPVPEYMAWMPQGRAQPARALQRALPQSYTLDPIPPEQPFYLAWTPRDSYFGKKLPFSVQRAYGLDPIPPAQPQLLDWQQRWERAGQSPPRARPRDYSIYPLQPPAAGYDPSTLEWKSVDSYSGKSLTRALPRSYVLDPIPQNPPIIAAGHGGTTTIHGRPRVLSSGMKI